VYGHGWEARGAVVLERRFAVAVAVAIAVAVRARVGRGRAYGKKYRLEVSIENSE